jgi:adenosylhomocysteine nucleosidase
MKPRVVILAALPREIAPLVRTWPSHSRSRHEGWAIAECDGAIAVCAGMGRQRVEYALQLAEQRGPLSAIWSVGYAGALRPGIARCCVCWPRLVIDAKTGSQFPCGGKDGTLVTADQVVEKEAKVQFAVRWNADLVDMETAVVARLAQERDLPFHSVRVVSDEFGDLLPDFNGFIDAHGGIRQAAFAMQITLHPWMIPTAARFGRHSWQASRNLAVALCQALELAE